MASWNLFIIGSGDGLLPDGTKPLAEPMLTNYQWGLVVFTGGRIHWNWFRHVSSIRVGKLLIQGNIRIFHAKMSWFHICFNCNSLHKVVKWEGCTIFYLCFPVWRPCDFLPCNHIVRMTLQKFNSLSITQITYRWLSAILQYLLCVSTGDTAVLH